MPLVVELVLQCLELVCLETADRAEVFGISGDQGGTSKETRVLGESIGFTELPSLCYNSGFGFALRRSAGGRVSKRPRDGDD